MKALPLDDVRVGACLLVMNDPLSDLCDSLFSRPGDLPMTPELLENEVVRKSPLVAGEVIRVRAISYPFMRCSRLRDTEGASMLTIDCRFHKFRKAPRGYARTFLSPFKDEMPVPSGGKPTPADPLSPDTPDTRRKPDARDRPDLRDTPDTPDTDDRHPTS
jgi:hypothetical protein